VNVALVFNLIRYDEVPPDRLDTIAELDSEETIGALKSALESAGHAVLLLEADDAFPENVYRLRNSIDMVFNIAEGRGDDSRESHVPVILEMLGIPYTGSGPLTLALCLDKVHTKEILTASGILTAAYQAFDTPDDPVRRDFPFPAVVKLRNQGSSMGLSPASLVHDRAGLRAQLERLYEKYRCPMFAEEFLPGREFTIPIIGNAPPRALPVVEIRYPESEGVKMRFFEPDEWVAERLNIPLRKQDVVTECPAKIGPELKWTLEQLALAAYGALGCRDWCRMEIRLDRDGHPRVIELNPIAGIDPSYWLPRSARVAGMSYEELIRFILDAAVWRYGAAPVRRRKGDPTYYEAPGGLVPAK
jgi:D-alanine-D-alanine ligase